MFFNLTDLDGLSIAVTMSNKKMEKKKTVSIDTIVKLITINHNTYGEIIKKNVMKNFKREFYLRQISLLVQIQILTLLLIEK